MQVTIDGAGRIVIPKVLREGLGFTPGHELELTAVDGVLEISVPPTPMHLERRNGALVAVPDGGPLPPLTAEMVRETLERVRR